MEGMEPFYMAAVARCPGMGSVRLQDLVEFMGSAQAIWESRTGDWQVPGIGGKLKGQFEDFRKRNQELPQ